MINKKLIIAHRGASFYEKENTIAAFKKAIELKADMVEFDVRKTLDNKIIIFHDEKIGKNRISRLSYKEINEKSGYKIPALEETLKFLKGKVKIDVHMKESGYEEEAMKLILKYFKERNILVCSEIPRMIKKIKENYPKIKTGLVMNIGIRNSLLFPSGDFTKRNIFNPATDFIIPRWQLVNRIFLAKARKYNKPVFPWIINNKKLAERFLKKDIIAGIITGKPDLIKKI